MLTALLLMFNVLYVGGLLLCLTFGTFTSLGVGLALLIAAPGVSGFLLEQTLRADLSPDDDKTLTDWVRATLTDQSVVLRTGWATCQYGPFSFLSPACLLVWQDDETTQRNGRTALILRHKIVTPECSDVQNILRKRAARLLWPNWPIAFLSSFTIAFIGWFLPIFNQRLHICEDIRFNTKFKTSSVHERLHILSQAQLQFKTLKFSTTPLAVL